MDRKPESSDPSRTPLPGQEPAHPATPPASQPSGQPPRYSEASLFRRIAHTAEKAGISVIYAVLVLFYTLQEPSTPAMAKLTILGALGYFISPIDFFPDMLPGGYADDIAIIIGALLTVAIHVNDVARKLAREKLHDWFGNYDEADLHELEARIDRHRSRKD